MEVLGLAQWSWLRVLWSDLLRLGGGEPPLSEGGGEGASFAACPQKGHGSTFLLDKPVWNVAGAACILLLLRLLRVLLLLLLLLNELFCLIFLLVLLCLWFCFVCAASA